MIQYSTRDILKKAKQAADLENTDFISYSENLTLLNDAYTKLYQTAINAGDLLYVKKMALGDPISEEADTDIVRKYELPEDFYQLYSVKAKGMGYYKYPLQRHVKDGIDSTPSYELKNNKLLVYGNSNNELCIEYYPIPNTLFVKPNDISLGQVTGVPVAYYKDVIATYDVIKETLYIMSVSDYNVLGSWNLNPDPEPQEGGIIPEKKPIIFKRAFLGYNAVAAIFSREGKDIIFYSPFNKTGKMVEYTNKVIVREDDGLFVEDRITPDVTNMLVTENEVYSILSSNGKETLNGMVDLPGTANHIDILEDDKLFITNAEGVITIFNVVSEDIITLKSRTERAICVGDYNISTGYGALVDKEGRGYVLESLINDTILDYPNNLYFSLISYSLAMAYKIKQNADISSLTVLYNETLDQYFTMFKRDANAPLRMNNIYR